MPIMLLLCIHLTIFATKADATVAIEKVEELKAKLEAAKEKSVAKADRTELAKAKETLKELAATENVTADKYDAAKADANQTVTDAETLIADPNATPSIANVNTKKVALAKAKEGLVDKATSVEGIEKHLRPFLYQIKQDALVQGTVYIEFRSDLSDKDILSKLDLPKGLEVIKIEKPTTDKLGVKSAKITIKLADGSYAIVEVPVEVVKKSIDNREENHSSVSKEDLKISKNTLPNTGEAEVNTGLVGLGLAVLGSLLVVAKRRKTMKKLNLVDCLIIIKE